MNTTEGMAMTFAGRELAYCNIFRFMLVAIQHAATSQPPSEAQCHLPYTQVLRQSLKVFRGEHLATHPNLPLSMHEAEIFQKAYREKFEELCKKLAEAMPGAD